MAWRRLSWTAAFPLIVALGLGGMAAAPPTPANITAARMGDPAASPGDWMSYGRTYDEQRFSPLTQINDRTAQQLGLAWYVDLETTRGMESTPLFIDGVLYNVESWNVATAYDARTGKPLWRFDPQVPRDTGGKACCDIISRGLAAWRGKILMATLDGRLIAIDARTGKSMWSVQTLEPGWPYTITGAPRVYDGVVVIGNAGAEAAVPGYVSGYDAETGRRKWRFRIVPGDPAKGHDKVQAMAAKTWSPGAWKNGGGGTAWDSFAYDAKLKLVYIGTGNGGPWAREKRSPGGGDNLFLSSIVALNVQTGAYAWHYQTTPGDTWDYTATQSLILADLPVGGRRTPVIMQAPKNGFFYVLDRRTGKLISAKPYTPITWASGIDMKTGRPIENPGVRYGERPVMISPGPLGGHNWFPMAYSPKTGLAYFAASQNFSAYAVNPDFQVRPGQIQQMGTSSTGYEAERQAIADYGRAHSRHWLAAWDPVAQKEAWRAPYPKLGSGGVLATAGNLVFQGTIERTLAAYRADTGQKVWEAPIQQVAMAGPITYALDGVQYVAVNAGLGGGMPHAAPTDAPISENARLLVFKLGGKAVLPPVQARVEARLDRPPVVTASAQTLKRGETLYANTCIGCHGARATGGMKDLRRSSPQTHAQYPDILLKGSRAEKGMASFASVLSPEDVEAIHQYIYKRINEDWENLK